MSQGLGIAYLIALILSTFITTALAVYTWLNTSFRPSLRRRGNKTELPTPQVIFCWLMTVLAFACWMFILRQLTSDETTVMTLLRLRYLGLNVFPVLSLMAVYAYIGTYNIYTWRWIAILYSIPILSQVFLWSNLSTLFFTSVALHNLEVVRLETLRYGFWFWTQGLYSIILLSVCGFIMIYEMLNSPQPFRNQLLWLNIGGSIVMLTMITTVMLGSASFPSLVPIGFAVYGLTFFWALSRHRLFFVAPIAHAAIVRQVRDPIVVLNPANQILMLNAAAESLFNLSQSKVIGTAVTSLISEAAQWADTSDLNTVIQLNKTPDKTRYFDVRISPLYERNLLIGKLITMRDITEQKVAQEEREHLIEELDAFSHSVAHDLKNPLGVIAGWVDLIREGMYDDLAEMHSYLDHITNTELRMRDIIDGLLLLSHVRNTTEVKRTWLDMNVLIAESLDELKLQIEAAKAEIELPESIPPAVGHGPWVRQVLINYLSNALKYGGRPAKVVITAEYVPVTSDTPPMVRYSVRDNGIGLTPEQQAAVFAPFTRFARERADGSGLGLSIVRRIIERLGGQVSVESEFKKGSTFSFTLPVALPPAELSSETPKKKA